MAIEILSDETILVALPKEPQLRYELETINETISSHGDYNVIIDFTRVEILTSSSISNLMILRDLQSRRSRKLILCNVSLPTKGIFNVAGLEGLFDFAEDKFAALAKLEHSNSHSQ